MTAKNFKKWNRRVEIGEHKVDLSGIYQGNKNQPPLFCLPKFSIASYFAKKLVSAIFLINVEVENFCVDCEPGTNLKLKTSH